jgi:hypothetical protein
MQAHEEIVWVGETQYVSRGWAGGILVIIFWRILLGHRLTRHNPRHGSFRPPFHDHRNPPYISGHQARWHKILVDKLQAGQSKERKHHFSVLKTNLPR